MTTKQNRVFVNVAGFGDSTKEVRINSLGQGYTVDKDNNQKLWTPRSGGTALKFAENAVALGAWKEVL